MIRAINNEAMPINLPGNTGENNEEGWVFAYSSDFRRRFANLLGFEFRNMHTNLGLAIMAPKKSSETAESTTKLPVDIAKRYITAYDLKRLESYSRNLVDYHMIMDLVPTLSKIFFDPQSEVMKITPVALSVL